MNPFNHYVEKRATIWAHATSCRQPLYTLNTHFFVKLANEGVSGEQADEGTSLCTFILWLRWLIKTNC